LQRRKVGSYDAAKRSNSTKNRTLESPTLAPK
jgi:hypothetical protein